MEDYIINEKKQLTKTNFKKELAHILTIYKDDRYLLEARDTLLENLSNLFRNYRSILKPNVYFRTVCVDPISSTVPVEFIEDYKPIDIDDLFINIPDHLIELLRELDEKITRESKELSDNYKKYNITPEGYYWLEGWNKNRQEKLLNELISILENDSFEQDFLDKIKNRIDRYIGYFDIVKAEPSADIISYITSIYVQLLILLKK